ncbi:hypothetical protein [Zavarzinella formosa]|uniref:hypothetical protein n=1 Tax=Zavarzinella formosa TaxID=360055 RepID=UPI0012F92418|nr:hypothetical protein [Zavarzinella formosa]
MSSLVSKMMRLGDLLVECDVNRETREYAERSALASISVHLDSLHMLELRVGDIVVAPNTSAPTPARIIDTEHMRFWKKYRIIQRDDKPFFWPEK